MNVSAFPFERTLEARRQDDHREFVLMAVDGLPSARAKKLLLEARAFDLLSDQDCELFIDALGIGGA